MRFKLVLIVGTLVAALGLGAGPAYPGATEEAPPTEPPNPSLIWPAPKGDVFLYLDTVTQVGCVQTNQYKRGAPVIFRMAIYDGKSGQVLTKKQMKYTYVTIPGLPNIGPFKFGKHGQDLNTAPWYWTLRWNVPADYPLGTVGFKVTVKTQENKFGYFKQAPIATAQLTIIP